MCFATCLESIADRFVFGGVNLDSALDKVEGDHHGVGDTTGQYTTQRT